ncbi:MAG: TipAS antibiotic-recognition domain-containing protein [Bacillota bacterium]|nr:TipAS antibiotic-recognition domain-containing protein [Bacillota bacterium]
MANFNPGYKSEFTDAEAAEAREARDAILRQLVAAMQAGVSADDARTVELVQQYRDGFIDKYLYKSTLIQFLGLSTVIATDPRNISAYEEYAAGFAKYLAAAFRAYYEAKSSAR